MSFLFRCNFLKYLLLHFLSRLRNETYFPRYSINNITKYQSYSNCTRALKQGYWDALQCLANSEYEEVIKLPDVITM